ncbi:substrate-binding periplasmic protein [Pseudobacteriovorax antillogorgiicola]|uniref:Amino acid ABC transporter substrate-binding protein, PAAT family n=1 Tax=Pseudobacteriovorax antillogorgiicola TaxID=1513793 RepID=A0A1Y6C1U9_9BACT|nr:transporter substrate-binding domain-containing protein [Pseudobacteriovorax antillogorgiicola]TCS50746.1 amino acid ABC transporter substrate-binding protein (PAAT family) [Pseudobacteriovorax antillogorgiicola]SMF41052.1 amino acid ABC transporter substrate-binding protein, PAAT family [Pseudobacteriovorax antillogorgiicola]
MSISLFRLLTFAILILGKSKSNLFAEVKSLTMVTLDWSPYYGKNLKNQGVITDIVKHAFQGSYATSLDFMPWSRAMVMVETGEYDILMGAYYTKERAQRYFVSDCIYSVKVRLATLSDSKILSYSDLRDLSGYKIGVSHGFANSEVFDNADYLTKDTAKNPLLNIRKLLTRRVDMIVVAEEVLNHQFTKSKKSDRKKLVFIDPILSINTLHIMASKKKDSNLLIIKDFNEGLRKIRENGTYASILKKHDFP